MVEPPAGPTGPIGIPKLKTAAPRAWRNLMGVVTGKGPQDLQKAQRAAARLRRR